MRASDSETWRAVAAALMPLDDWLAPALILAPQALGGHADHRHVVRAVGALCDAARSGDAPPVAWYRDTPYVLRDASVHPPVTLDDGSAGTLDAHVVPLDTRTLLARQAACVAYATQLRFQFGGANAARTAIAGLAATEGAAVGFSYAERLYARPRAAAVLVPLSSVAGSHRAKVCARICRSARLFIAACLRQEKTARLALGVRVPHCHDVGAGGPRPTSLRSQVT